MICRSERICENGRVKVYWRCAVPDELSDVAEKFITNCRRLRELSVDETIRAEFTYSDKKARIDLRVGQHSLIYREFFVNFF